MKQRTSGGRSLQTVLTGSFLACVGVLLLFVVLTLVPRVSTLLTQNAVDRTRETVLQSVSSLDIYIDDMLSTLHFASSQVSSNAPDALRERLLLLQSSRADIASLAFFTEEGELYAGTAGALRVSPAEVRGSEWFQKAMDWEGTATYFSAPHVQHLFANQRSLVVTMTRRLDYRRDGRWCTGVMLMDFDYNALSSVVNGVSLGQSGYVYLMDENGELICHPRLQQIYQGLAQEDRTAAQAQLVGVTQDSVP